MNIKNNKNCKVTINDEEVEKYIIKPEMADKKQLVDLYGHISTFK